jgi:amidase/6-aminohexanoate-cyclic-dimer hydrolase
VNTHEYVQYDATGLADLIRRGEVRPAEVLDACCKQIRAHKSLNAVVLELETRARRQIEAGLPNSIFSGVPFLLKDLGQHYQGTVTSNGSTLFRDQVARNNSTLVKRYLDAGLVIVGKTNTPELGLATTTEPRLFGPTHNPHNFEHSPGGSSGGAAAAVAAGIVPVAHASDGGGSIRIPASSCGLFGLKPTRGRIPLGPDELEGWGGLSTAHVVARSVRDSALLLDLTQGDEPGSPYAAPPPPRSWQLESERTPKGLRIAVSMQSFSGVPVLPEIVEVLHATAGHLRRLGHVVTDAAPVIDAVRFRQSHGVLAISHVAATLHRQAQVLGRLLRDDDVERVTWQNYTAAKDITGADYAQARADAQHAGRVIDEFLGGYDLLLTPTMAMLPPRLGEMDMMGSEPGTYLEILYRMIAFTALFNDTGHPAISVPVAMSRQGLPVGMQFAARHGGEGLLLRIARQLEREGIAAARLAGSHG